MQKPGTTPRAKRRLTTAWPALLVGAIVGACVSPPPEAPAAAAGLGPISIEAIPVPLNPQDPSVSSLGDFHYAGGLELKSAQTNLLHELSDLIVTDKNRIVAVGDEGVQFEAQLVLDAAGRLTGVADASLTTMIGEDGRPIAQRSLADAEGLTQLPSGDRLVSFEGGSHRIWLYPAAGGPPRAVPSPHGKFPTNAGLEALTAEPDAGGDAYIVGAEESGATWTCRLTSPCVEGPTVEKPREFGLVSINRLPAGTMAYLLRAYDAVRGSRVTLKILRAGIIVAQLDLAAPMTVDNFEGMSSVPDAGGGRRFYLLSDDNGSDSQRTLLLAFDWQPQNSRLRAESDRRVP
jgi:hypothetical protein